MRALRVALALSIASLASCATPPMVVAPVSVEALPPVPADFSFSLQRRGFPKAYLVTTNVLGDEDGCHTIMTSQDELMLEVVAEGRRTLAHADLGCLGPQRDRLERFADEVERILGVPKAWQRFWPPPNYLSGNRSTR